MGEDSSGENTESESDSVPDTGILGSVGFLYMREMWYAC